MANKSNKWKKVGGINRSANYNTAYIPQQTVSIFNVSNSASGITSTKTSGTELATLDWVNNTIPLYIHPLEVSYGFYKYNTVQTDISYAPIPSFDISNNTYDRFYLELYTHDDGVPQYKIFVHNTPNNIKQYITVDNSFVTSSGSGTFTDDNLTTNNASANSFTIWTESMMDFSFDYPIASNQIWIRLAGYTDKSNIHYTFLKVNNSFSPTVAGLLSYTDVTTAMNSGARPHEWNSFTINITSGTSSTSSTSGTSGTSSNLSLDTENLLSNNVVIQDLTQQVSDTKTLLLQQKETINTMATTLNAPSQRAINEINQKLNCMNYTLNVPSKAMIGRIDNTINEQEIRIRSQENQIKKIARSLNP
jgi:hypothetical protein